MEKDKLTIQARFPISKERLYTEWLDAEQHSNFTGGEAVIDHSINGDYSTWDGYIKGKTIGLTPHDSIIQTWKTAEFNEEDDDSILELTFESDGEEMVKFTLNHTNIPAGEGEKYKQGWDEHYIQPMKQYYKNS